MTRLVITALSAVAIIAIAYFGYNQYLLSLIRTTPLVDPAIAHSTVFTLETLSSHNTTDDCWTTVGGKVYDITTFINIHPGGSAINPACGADGSQLFASVREHFAENAQSVLDMYQIGILSI